MKIPNFKSEEGSVLYKDTVGKLISPKVGEILLTHVTNQLKSHSLQSALDLACGPGTVSVPLAATNPTLTITAVDSSQAMISLAQQEASRRGIHNIQFQTMDASQIDFEPESFDLVLCNLAFPFFTKPYDSVRDVFSIIRPGGFVCFTVPGRDTWAEFFAVAESVLGDMISMARPFLSKFTQAEVLPDALEVTGFEGVEERHTRLPFHFDSGESTLQFFGKLFHLLDYATPDMKSGLAEAIDAAHPDGFTMHYDAVLLSGQRPGQEC